MLMLSFMSQNSFAVQPHWQRKHRIVTSSLHFFKYPHKGLLQSNRLAVDQNKVKTIMTMIKKDAKKWLWQWRLQSWKDSLKLQWLSSVPSSHSSTPLQTPEAGMHSEEIWHRKRLPEHVTLVSKQKTSVESHYYIYCITITFIALHSTKNNSK